MNAIEEHNKRLGNGDVQFKAEMNKFGILVSIELLKHRTRIELQSPYEFVNQQFVGVKYIAPSQVQRTSRIVRRQKVSH